MTKYNKVKTKIKGICLDNTPLHGQSQFFYNNQIPLDIFLLIDTVIYITCFWIFNPFIDHNNHILYNPLNLNQIKDLYDKI